MMMPEYFHPASAKMEEGAGLKSLSATDYSPSPSLKPFTPGDSVQQHYRHLTPELRHMTHDLRNTTSDLTSSFGKLPATMEDAVTSLKPMTSHHVGSPCVNTAVATSPGDQHDVYSQRERLVSIA